MSYLPLALVFFLIIEVICKNISIRGHIVDMYCVGAKLTFTTIGSLNIV